MSNIEQLRTQATSQDDRTVTVSRVIDAPREAAFRAWTNPERWAHWYAPEPLTVPRAETDPRPGGRYTFVMRDEEGNDYTTVGTYQEVVEPERIVFTDSSAQMPSSFMDVLNQARGMAPGTPVEDGVATVTFEDVGGKTKMTFSEQFDSRATRDAWVQMQMVEGLQQGFDALEQMLAKESIASR